MRFPSLSVLHQSEHSARPREVTRRRSPVSQQDLVILVFAVVSVSALLGLAISWTLRDPDQPSGGTGIPIGPLVTNTLMLVSSVAAAMGAAAAWRAAKAAEGAMELQLHNTESTRRSTASSSELSSILDRLSETGTDEIDPLLRARIVAWSQAMKPYRALQYTSGSFEFRKVPLSPEKGQLVGILVSAGIPLTSFAPGLDIRRSDLRGFQLAGANLQGLDLHASDLADADLRDAMLDGTVLSHVNLVHANLRGAHLVGADLTGAHLRGTDLDAAIFDGAPDACCWDENTTWPPDYVPPEPARACTAPRQSTTFRW